MSCKHGNWEPCTCGDLTTLGVVHRKDAPCYYPEKREWVGLTDDEAWGMLGQMSLGAGVEDIRFVEAKLKEKNA